MLPDSLTTEPSTIFHTAIEHPSDMYTHIILYHSCHVTSAYGDTHSLEIVNGLVYAACVNSLL